MRTKLWLPIVLLLSMPTVSNAQTGIRFAGPSTFGNQTNANCAAVADIDGDGHLDVLLGDGTNVWLWRNDGQGELIGPDWNPLGTVVVTSIAVGDVDRNGYVDVLIGTTVEDKLFLNEGGALSRVASWTSEYPVLTTRGVGLGDVDGDGDLDIILAEGNDFQQQANRVYRNQGGTVENSPFWIQQDAPFKSTAVEVGDVNGDGRADVVFANQDGPNRLYLGHPTELLGATFAWQDAESLQTSDVALGDMDGDGILDLLCANNRFAATMHLGNGNDFSLLADWTRPEPAGEDYGITLGDIDLDGDLDVVFARQVENAVYMNVSGQPDSMVWESEEIWATAEVLLADLDGEGDLELVQAGVFRQSGSGDILASPGAVYRNRVAYYNPVPDWESEASRKARDLELVDINGDGDLDLFVAHVNDYDYVYEFHGDTFGAWDWRSARRAVTNDAAFFDMDGDGDPDLLCGQDSTSVIYRNDSGVLTPDSVWSFDNGGLVLSVTGGDWWGDGCPDPYFGMDSAAHGVWDHIACNECSGLPERSACWEGTQYPTFAAITLEAFHATGEDEILISITTGIHALGVGQATNQGPFFNLGLIYADADHYVDILASESGIEPRAAVYLNDAGAFQTMNAHAWQTTDIIWQAGSGDVDGDGWVDIVCTAPATGASNIRMFRNLGGGSFASEATTTVSTGWMRYMRIGDIDGDGDLDIAAAVGARSGCPGRPSPACTGADPLGPASVFFSSQAPVFKGSHTTPTHQLPQNPVVIRDVAASLLQDNLWEVAFSLYDVESDPVRVTLEYQYEGEGVWRPMQLSGAAGTYASSPAGQQHIVRWDITEAGFYRHPISIRLQATDMGATVGSSAKHVSRFVKKVGRVVPRRPALVAGSPRVTFPTVTMGDTVEATVTIRNAGNEVLVIDDVLTPVPSMVVTSGGTAPLAPGELDTLILEFAPRAEVVMPGDIQINSNDPLNSPTRLPVSVDVRVLGLTSEVIAPAGPLDIDDDVVVVVKPLDDPRVERGYLLHRPAGQAAFLDSVALEPFGADAFVGLIPSEALFEVGLEYYVRLENSGVFGLDPPGAPVEFYSREVAPPTTVTAQTLPNDGQRYGQGMPIEVRAELPPGSAFQRGWVYYRAGATADYDTVAMVRNGDVVRCEIPGAMADVRGVEYWLEVETLGAHLTAPATDPGSNPYVIRTTLADIVDPVAHSGRTYRLLSFPADVEGGPLAALVDDLGGQDDARWRLFSHAGGTDYIPVDQVPRFEVGRAYWLITDLTRRVDSAPVLALSTDTSEPFERKLDAGWNLVGNPFPFDVAWGDVIRDTLTMSGAPQTWDGSQYVDATTLEPFTGYWVHNDADSLVSIWIPPIEHAGPGTTTPTAVPLAWGIDVTASGEARARGVLQFGVSDSAKDTRDGMDGLLPPPVPESPLDLYAVGEGGQWLSRDARSASMAPGWGQAWRFEVAVARNGRVPVTLGFAFDAVPEGAEVLLLDREVKRTHDLSDGTAVEVYVTGATRKTSPDDTRFVLLVGDAQYIEEHRSLLPGPPTQTALHQNFPNPFNPTTVIRYELAHPGRVSLKIYDVRGALVRTLVDGDQAASRYEVGWDGVDNRGSRVASGIYFYRLLSSEGTVLTRKMVLLK